jgi:DNA-binding NarL/FixJ family response regulator
MRIVVADDQLLVCAGVKALLEKSGTDEVVASALDGQACLNAVELHRPDALILDLGMPRMDGFAVMAALRERGGSAAVIVLSATTDAATCQRALAAGARGYLSKDLLIDELPFALQCVSRGHSYVSPSLPLDVAGRASAAAGQSKMLSPRQTDVLRAIAEGKSNKHMAREMGISVKTVEYHRAELMQKLDIHDVAGLTRYALRWLPETVD